MDAGLTKTYEQRRSENAEITAAAPKRMPGESEAAFNERLRLFTLIPIPRVAAGAMPRK